MPSVYGESEDAPLQRFAVMKPLSCVAKTLGALYATLRANVQLAGEVLL